ncbi:hypothetical protein MARBORIA2_17310 [Methanobrevibacter arboriphilus]|nr:hypothetical protein MARBORIA2_17310 [Methanobrevibacter arboriphilus]
MHTAITIPHITKITQQFTGKSGYGVGLDASSSNNTNITFANNNITGTYAPGVYLSASSDNNDTYKPKPYNITGTYGVDLYADSDNNTTYNQNYTTIHRNIRLWCCSGCIQR